MNVCKECGKKISYNKCVNGWICNNKGCERFHPIRSNKNKWKNKWIIVDKKDIRVFPFLKGTGMIAIKKEALK
jgi:hypothetical protein